MQKIVLTTCKRYILTLVSVCAREQEKLMMYFTNNSIVPTLFKVQADPSSLETLSTLLPAQPNKSTLVSVLWFSMKM